MNTKKAQGIGFTPLTSINDGIIETINWYIKYGKKFELKKYNSFKENK